MLKLTVETIRLTQMRISNQKARAYSAIVSRILCIVAGLAIILVGHDRSSSDIDTETETPDFDYKNHQELTLTTDNEKSMSGADELRSCRQSQSNRSWCPLGGRVVYGNKNESLQHFHGSAGIVSLQSEGQVCVANSTAQGSDGGTYLELCYVSMIENCSTLVHLTIFESVLGLYFNNNGCVVDYKPLLTGTTRCVYISRQWNSTFVTCWYCMLKISFHMCIRNCGGGL